MLRRLDFAQGGAATYGFNEYTTDAANGRTESALCSVWAAREGGNTPSYFISLEGVDTWDELDMGVSPVNRLSSRTQEHASGENTYSEYDISGQPHESTEKSLKVGQVSR